jgi:hypothetical protein
LAQGSLKTEAPLAVEMLMFRHTAVEMGVIGFLCRGVVTEDWRKRVEALDYAEIMRAVWLLPNGF